MTLRTTASPRAISASNARLASRSARGVARREVEAVRVAGGRGRGRERADEDAVRHDDAGPRRVGLGRERVELGPPRLDETRTDGQRRGAPRDGRRAADGGEVDRRRLRRVGERAFRAA